MLNSTYYLLFWHNSYLMTPPAKTFKDLIVWQKAHSLVLKIYKLTQTLLKEEQYGIISQIGRTVVSIPSNIAEGFPRKTNIDKPKFLISLKAL